MKPGATSEIDAPARFQYLENPNNLALAEVRLPQAAVPVRDTLLPAAKASVYARMWEVFSGAAKDWDYSKLSRDDRRAILEILRQTKRELPEYFIPARIP